MGGLWSRVTVFLDTLGWPDTGRLAGGFSLVANLQKRATREFMEALARLRLL
jgi:hypothetical protein